MNLPKIFQRFATRCEQPQELKRVARALGHELPKHRLDELTSFRSQLAAVTPPPDTYAAGYVEAMLDIAAEVEGVVRELSDNRTARKLAMRNDCREVLVVLRGGPKLPSDLAEALGKDRASISRTLTKLRQAGLVQSYASADMDGRTRPHRLTVQGQRVAADLPGELSPEFQQGVQLAVRMFRELVSRAALPAADLAAIASDVIEDEGLAAAAAKQWAAEAADSGLIAQARPSIAQGSGPVSARADALWTSAPALLDQVQAIKTGVPVYVRTGDAWGAWAYALQTNAPEQSRTIVNGDIVSQSIEPPATHFALVYDNLGDITADANNPTMRRLWSQADEKYVVTAPGDSIPDGFVQLKLTPED